MKCCAILALATGAYAGSDVSPPVISLSLAAGDYADRNCQTHSCARKNSAGHESATCEVGTTSIAASDTCVLPKCKAYDHHQGVFECEKVYKMVNVDGTICTDGMERKLEHNDKKHFKKHGNTDGTIDSCVAADVNKNVRSEWLLTYDAEDASGNAADTVSFTMIFQDTVKPVITTLLGQSLATNSVRAAGDTKNSGRSFGFAESCSQGGDTAPCTYNLPLTATADDNYDGDVSEDIKVRLTRDGQTTGAQTWTLQSALTELAIDTRVVDVDDKHWTLEYTSNDHAGIFGYGEQDNVFEQTVAIHITDNTAPVITQAGHPGHAGTDLTIECHKDTTLYNEPGANCHDKRDQWSANLGKYIPKAADVGGDAVKTSKIGADLNASGKTYTVEYTCTDEAGNDATPSKRAVLVRDTTPPVITMVGPDFIENSMGAHNNEENPHSYEGSEGLKLDKLTAATGATCEDACDTTPEITATLHYGPDCGADLVSGGDVTKFPELVPGYFSIKYVCSDGKETDTRNELTDSVCRKIFNQDYTKPVIEVLGDNPLTFEASHKGNYVDDGATCSDQVDGVISQNVEVSGDVVNLSKVGTYVITYNCQDKRGNFAPTMTRSVHVKQTSCPTCVCPTCAEVLEHEASFPFTDTPVSCTDPIDGKVPTVIETAEAVNVEAVGTYFITYRAVNSVGLWNDGTCSGGKNTYVRTVVVKDTLKPVIQIQYKGVQVGRSSGTDKSTLSAVERANPAKDHVFMAEQASSSASGWILGAAASAVAGVALLGLSQRKAAAVAVPV